MNRQSHKEEDQKRLQGEGSFQVRIQESKEGAHTSLTQTTCALRFTFFGTFCTIKGEIERRMAANDCTNIVQEVQELSVTIKDVARKAGVSLSTVSRVISGHPRISEKTAQRVLRVMDELGYHPNIMAKSLISKTTNTLGIILPRPAEELFKNYFFHEA